MSAYSAQAELERKRRQIIDQAYQQQRSQILDRGGFMGAPETVQTQFGQAAAPILRSAKMGANALSGVALPGPLAPLGYGANALQNWLSWDPAIDAAERAASGEPGVLWDVTSENPLNWQAQPELVDVAGPLADIATVGTGAATKAVRHGGEAVVDALGRVARAQGPLPTFEVGENLAELEAVRRALPGGGETGVVPLGPTQEKPLPTLEQALEDYLGPVERDPYKQSPSGVAPGETVNIVHYGKEPEVDALLAGRYGTGLKGEEAGRLTHGEGMANRPRVHFYEDVEGLKPEVGVGPHAYRGSVPGVYDIGRDTEGLAKRAIREVDEEMSAAEYPPGERQSRVRNRMETLIKDAGYRGMIDRSNPEMPWGAMFEDIDVAGEFDTLATQRNLELKRQAEAMPPENVSDMGRAANVATNLTEDVPTYKKGGKNYPRGGPGITTRGVANQQRRWERMVKEGEEARDWYPRDAAAAAQLTSGRFEPARELISAATITSPQTKVAGNATFATRMYLQNAVDDAINSGIFPNSMKDDFRKIIDDIGADIGRKRGSFQGNLMQHWPETPQGATIDMQMKRAGHYPNIGDDVSDFEYEYMERLTSRIADKLNKADPTGRQWTPSEVQAAIWTAQKMRTEKKAAADAGLSLSNVWARDTAQMPYEVTPGGVEYGAPREVTPIPRTEGMKSWEPAGLLDDVNQLYSRDLIRALQDPYGANVIAREMGALQMPQFQGLGIWGDQRNPNVVAQVAIPQSIGGRAGQDIKVSEGLGRVEERVTKEGKVEEVYKSLSGRDQAQRLREVYADNQVDPSARKMMNAVAATNAKALNQEAVAWVMPSQKAVPQYAQNYARITIPGWDKNRLGEFNRVLEKVQNDPATKKKFPKFYDEDGDPKDYLPVVPAEDGVQVWRPFDNETGLKSGVTKENAGDQLERMKAARYIIGEAAKRMNGRPKWGFADSGYIDQSAFEEAVPAGSKLREKADRVLETVQRDIVGPHQEWYKANYPMHVQQQIAKQRQGNRRVHWGNQGLF